MSIVAPPLVNKSAVEPIRVICYSNNMVSSQGIFLGDNPLTFSLPTFLLEMSIIYLTTRAVHYVLQPLGQPKCVSQIITGIILGPSVIGQSEKFRTALFPARSIFMLDAISILSLSLALFVIGVKTDLSLLKKPGKRALTIGIVSAVFPFMVASIVFFACRSSFPSDLRRTYLILYLAERLSLSSLAVLSEALEELGLLNSNLGRIVMSATLITDVCSWGFNAIVTSIILIFKSKSPAIAAASLASFIGFVIVIAFVVRPVMLKVVQRTPNGEMVSESCFLGMVVSAMVAAFVTEAIGYHPTLGPLLLGLALPGGMPLGVTLTERLEVPMSSLFLPLYLVIAGYRTDFSSINDIAAIGYIELVVFICYAGKLLGAVGAGIYLDMPVRDAFTVGLMLNIKGIIEVSFFNFWGVKEVATSQHFSVLMISLLIVTSITTPLVKFIYNPIVRYVTTKRRTIQHLKPNHPLRILTCLHTEDQVPPILDILEASNPTPYSPLMLYLLHLTPFTGGLSAVLRPHRSPKHTATTNATSNLTPSDHIVNAFRYFENNHPTNSISLSPFIAVSPIPTMHNDVCSLALDKKARLILLPFHKLSDGARETARAGLQILNRNVLDFAPCSVAIVVDRAIVGGGGNVPCISTNHLLQRAVVYFLGGADDREALSIAMRMAAGGVALTVVRFRLTGEVLDQEEEEEEDDEVIGEVRLKYGDVEGVVYVEKLVADGEGTVAVVKNLSDKFDLVIVGRRKGPVAETGLTAGLSMWSECPELGVLGDMLVGTEFGGKVAIMVVQQQEMVGGGRRKGEQVVKKEPNSGLLNKGADHELF